VHRVALEPDSWRVFSDAITINISKLQALQSMAYGVHLSKCPQAKGNRGAI